MTTDQAAATTHRRCPTRRGALGVCRWGRFALVSVFIWPAGALGETLSSSCALFGPERAAELDWTTRQAPVPIADGALARRLRACFGKGADEPILRGDLHRLRRLRHQGEHLDAIARLDGIEHAANLEELRLPGNQVADLAPLAGLGALRVLDLARNQVADVSPLAANAGLGAGASVDLTGNPLGRAALDGGLRRIAERGLQLAFDRPRAGFFPPAGFVRVVNHGPESGEVRITGFSSDASVGAKTRQFELRFGLAGNAAANFRRFQLPRVAGFVSHGGRVGAVDTLEFETDLDIEVLTYAYYAGGLLTAMHDQAPVSLGLPVFHAVDPDSDGLRESSIRLEHRGGRADGADREELLLHGHDDAGEGREGRIAVSKAVPQTFSATALADAGLGAGGWRLRLSRVEEGQAGAWAGMSLLRSPSGHLANLSTRPHRLESPWLPAAGNPLGEGVVRVVNRSNRAGAARIFAVDDAGGARGPVELALGPRQTRRFTSRDLEEGNALNGLSSGIGAGAGDWRLRFESELDIVALTHLRHADGFLAPMHDVAPSGLGRHGVATFAPGSNAWGRSLLRIVNVGAEAASVTVRGTDDRGRRSAGVVRLNLPAGAARTLTAAQLEEGGAELAGRLGDGAGRWRLAVESRQPLRVMSLMESGGRLTNISTAMRLASAPAPGGPPGDADGDGVADDVDVDDDDDGIADARDALPLDPTESVDTDGDGIGNLADDDDDGDGVADAVDGRPLDASGHTSPDVADFRHYRFVGEHRGDWASYSIAAGDFDCDGVGDLVVGAPLFISDGRVDGAVYLASLADLPAADAADGRIDGVVYLGRVADEPRSWKLLGGSPSGNGGLAEAGGHYLGIAAAVVGDMGGDGCADLLLGAHGLAGFAGSAYLVSGLDLGGADRADGFSDGVVDVRRLVEQPGSYEFLGESGSAGWRVGSGPDLDGDGFDELLVAAPAYSSVAGTEEGDRRGAAYLLARRDLAALDAADGAVDGRVALASIEHGRRSRRIVGAPGDELLGLFLANGEFDGDGRPDLLLGGANALYLLAAADVPVLDAADGAEDGLLDLGFFPAGDASWKLAGEIEDLVASGRATRSEGRFRWRNVAAGDFDGDGLDDLMAAAQLPWFHYPDTPLPSHAYQGYLISASALDAADRADGTADRTAGLEHAVAQEGSLLLVPRNRDNYDNDGGFGAMAFADMDGDGIDDAVIGDAWEEGFTVGVRWRGAVYIASGSYLSNLAVGVPDLFADFGKGHVYLPFEEPDGVGLWKLVGGVGERLGYRSKPAVSDLDGDGELDLVVRSSPVTAFYEWWWRPGPGTAIAISGGVLGEADAWDGDADGVVRLGSLLGEYDRIIDDSLEVATTQFNENLVVMEISGETSASLRQNDWTYFYELAPKLYEIYEDAFDFLFVFTNTALNRGGYCGTYRSVNNAATGTGRRMRNLARFLGSPNKLLGVVEIYGDFCVHPSTMLHEIMHQWGNSALPSSTNDFHWGFSSANGMLGGFDRRELRDLGDGRYSAGNFSPVDAMDKPYGAIELYMAGLLPASEVPDIWVASDGQWTGEFEQGGFVFAASEVEDWSVERIIEEHGPRTPTVADSQKAFRGIAVLVADQEQPPDQAKMAELSALLDWFSRPQDDPDDPQVNFYEATGGRATFSFGELTRWRKPDAAVALASGSRPVGNVGFPPGWRAGRFGGALRAGAHRFCATEHVHLDAGPGFSGALFEREKIPMRVVLPGEHARPPKPRMVR